MTKPETKSQLDKFKETAREVETDDSEEAFDRALKAVIKPPKKLPQEHKRR